MNKMKIRSRKLIIPSKSVDDILNILKSMAFLPRGKFEQDRFSFFCLRRRNGKVTWVPVKGTIRQDDNHVVVTLEIHAGLTFFIGNIVSLFGGIWIFSKLITQSTQWNLGILLILFGLIGSSIPVLTASEVLDRLEFKLQR